MKNNEKSARSHPRLRKNASRLLAPTTITTTDICVELKKTREAKRKVWREQLEKIAEEKNTNREWSVVRGLRGDVREERGKSMMYNGKWRITPAAKANAFIDQYARISGRKSNRRTRREVVTAAKHLRRQGPRTREEVDFTEVEIRESIRRLKNGKAAGPDGIRPEFIKNLPDNAISTLCEIINDSWNKEWVPQEWRTATIVPILKKGKDGQEVGSYRPISLTSQLGKLMERTIANRLTWWLEDKAAISPYQAGFRAGLAVCTYDKWRHMGLEDVRRTTADGDVVQRTRKKDWRGQCRLIHETLVTEGERPERTNNVAPPWRVGVPGGVMLAKVSKTATVEEQRGAALEALRRVGPVDRCVYTDGAAEGGISNGGAGVAVYDREGTCLRGWSCAAGRSCSSYSAEMVAMDEAVRWLGESREWQSAAVATDSRSLIDALQGSGQADGLGALRERLWRLHDERRRLTLVWVPGHCQLPGNEEADRLAGEGCGMDQEEVALTGSTRLAVIRRGMREDDVVTHGHLREVYVSGIRSEEEAALTRGDRVD